MLKKIYILMTPLFLVGCIGSQFVVDDAENFVKFPNLHDVPERPEFIAKDTSELKIKLTTDQQKTLNENKKLRSKYGL